MKSKLYKLSLFCLIMVFSSESFSQNRQFVSSDNGSNASIDENLLMETHWRYSQTVDMNAGQIIHSADDDYDYYLYLKFDYTYSSHLNGKIKKGTWLLNNKSNELYYDFRNIKWWKIVELSNARMVLQFKIKSDVYNYTFNRVDKEDTPFERKRNELPEVLVEDQKVLKKLAKKQKKTQKLQAKLDKKRGKKEYIPIEIYLVGGGYYGGIDPVLKDYISIKGKEKTGTLIREFQSKQKGLQKHTEYINYAEVEKLAKFIEANKFFDMAKTYDCTSGDCQQRKKAEPIPVPLRVSVRYGNKFHVITIMLYGEDDYRKKYVDYPEEIDRVVEGIRKMVEINI